MEDINNQNKIYGVFDPWTNTVKNEYRDNYEYNTIGQLVKDYSKGCTYEYNASGLVSAVNFGYEFSETGQPYYHNDITITFKYNERGVVYHT